MKGTRWHFGMKANMGVDSTPGLVHPMLASLAIVRTCSNLVLHGRRLGKSEDRNKSWVPEGSRKVVNWLTPGRSQYKKTRYELVGQLSTQ